MQRPDARVSGVIPGSAEQGSMPGSCLPAAMRGPWPITPLGPFPSVQASLPLPSPRTVVNWRRGLFPAGALHLNHPGEKGVVLQQLASIWRVQEPLSQLALHRGGELGRSSSRGCSVDAPPNHSMKAAIDCHDHLYSSHRHGRRRARHPASLAAGDKPGQAFTLQFHCQRAHRQVLQHLSRIPNMQIDVDLKPNLKTKRTGGFIGTGIGLRAHGFGSTGIFGTGTTVPAIVPDGAHSAPMCDKRDLCPTHGPISTTSLTMDTAGGHGGRRVGLGQVRASSR